MNPMLLDYQLFADWLRQYDGVEIAMFVALFLAIIRYMWKWAKAALPQVEAATGFLRSLGKLPSFMSSAETLLKELRHEVFPNDGRSLRDELGTLSVRTEKIEAKMMKDSLRLNQVDHELRYREANNVGVPARRAPNPPTTESIEVPNGD